MLQSYKCCSVYDQSGGLFSAKDGWQPRTVAVKRPDEVPPPPVHRLHLQKIPHHHFLSCLRMRVRQTTSSVSSLSLGSTFPNPGKAYEVFPAAISIKTMALHTPPSTHSKRSVPPKLTERSVFAPAAAAALQRPHFYLFSVMLTIPALRVPSPLFTTSTLMV